MANDIITTLHPENDDTINLYPNIKRDNIPNGAVDNECVADSAIDMNKLRPDVISLLNSINELHPSGTATSSTILAYTTNKGIYVGTDTGKWYYWNGSQYVVGGDFLSASGVIAYKNTGTNVNFNTLETNAIYNVLVGSGTYSNAPDDFSTGENYILIDITTNTGAINGLRQQILIDSDGNNRCRYYASGWSSWQSQKSTKWNNTGRNVNFNTLKTNTIYNICVGSTGTASNAPSNFSKNEYYTLIDMTTNTGEFTGFRHQILIDSEGGIFLRCYVGNAWQDWIGNNPSLIKIGSGQRYTTLREGFAVAYAQKNSKVYVYPGTYDLATEFADVISNHTSDRLTLGHNMDVVFYSGAYVKCLLEATPSDWAFTNFAPFVVGEGDFRIEGLDIESSNCRYCIHDDRGSSDGTPSVHKYINCRMKQSTTSTTEAGYYQCIGGGMNQKTTIIIEGGYYQSHTISGHETLTPDDMQQPITYHNGSNANCDGRIYISNIYVADKGYLSFGYYGSSTKVTPIQISNCSFYKEPVIVAETEQSTNINFALTTWNNEIRNS